MKKMTFAVLAAGMMMSQLASADVIKCVFTEPFVNTTYSMTQSTLTIDAAGEGKSVIQNVSFQIKGAGQFELVAKNGKVLQKLSLDNKGSDGMSDKNYPYTVTDSSQSNMANNGIGGCTSNSLKATGE